MHLAHLNAAYLNAPKASLVHVYARQEAPVIGREPPFIGREPPVIGREPPVIGKEASVIGKLAPR